MSAVEKSGSFAIGGDLPVHRMGFGAMRIIGEGVWGPPADPAEAHAVLRRTVELGIDFIDTADVYGPNFSEELIGEVLAPYAPGLVIATKGGLTRAAQDAQFKPTGRPDHLRRTIEGSLSRLKLDRIDLYQLHRIDPEVPLEDSVGALRDLRAEGKIRHIGLSEVDVAQIERARAIVEIVSVQNLYNLGDRRHEAVLDHCAANGIGFIPWFPLAAGKLAKPGGPLETIAERHGAAPSQVALAWLLRRSPAILLIPGTSSVKHLEMNVAASDIVLTDEDYATLDEMSAVAA